METHMGKLAPPHGLSIFRLFALFIVARLAIDLPERVAPAFGNKIAGTYYEFLLKYQDYFDTAYLLVVVVAACVTLRRWREPIVRSELAPFCAMLVFALLLPSIRQLLADAVMTIVNLVAMGRIGETRGFDRYLVVEPARTIVQVVLGIGAALVWRQALGRIFGVDVQQIVRRGITPARGMWLLWPLLLYAIALPAVNGLAAWTFGATWRWYPFGDGFALNYMLAICILAAGLFAARDAVRRSELSPVMVVLSFVLLTQLVHNLIDREILLTVRHLSKDQMPWEESLRVRLPINYIANAVYRSMLTVVGAASAYGILRLIFGRDLAAVVRRVEPAVPKAGHVG